VPDTATATPTDKDTADTLAGSAETVHVDDYGATPDDGTDDTQAIRDAIADLGDGDTLAFSDGAYYVSVQDGSEPIFTIENLTNLTVEGNDAKLSLATTLVDGQEQYTDLFLVERCDGLTVSDLTIDWDRSPPHTCGSVVDDTSAYFDVEVNDFYEPRDTVSCDAVLEYDPGTETYPAGELNNDAPVSVLDSSTLRVDKAGSFNHSFADGQDVVVNHTKYDGRIFEVYGSDDITFRYVFIRSGPGMAFVVEDGDSPTIENSIVTPSDESQRWQSTEADAIHMGNVWGQPLINNVTASHTGDDGWNIHTTRFNRVDIVDDTTVQLHDYLNDLNEHYVPLAAGDVVDIGTGQNGHPYENTVEYTIDTVDVRTSTNDIDVTFTRPLASAVRNATDISIYPKEYQPSEATIVNSTFRTVRGGGRAMTDNLTIDNTTHANTTGIPVPAFARGPIPPFAAAGTPTNNLVISDSTFDNTGGIHTFIRDNFDTDDLSTRAYANWELTNNTFLDHGAIPAIDINWISDVTIEGNDFSGVADGVEPVRLGDTVALDAGPSVVDGTPVRDPDGDGLYEDINGDGSTDILDVRALFQQRDADAVQDNPGLFDFSQDGSFDLLDVRSLFDQVR
jgi:hypothetical protein